MRRFTLLPLVLVVALGLAACASDEDPVEPVDEPIEPDMVETTAGPDTTGAAVWAFLGDETYQTNWGLWPDKGEFYTGQEPHGMLLTTYLNATAMEALQGGATEMPAGAVTGCQYGYGQRARIQCRASRLVLLQAPARWVARPDA